MNHAVGYGFVELGFYQSFVGRIVYVQRQLFARTPMTDTNGRRPRTTPSLFEPEHGYRDGAFRREVLKCFTVTR